MDQHDPRQDPFVSDDAQLPPTAADATRAAPGDANGFDPNEFEWRPVPRRPRADGWTPEVQRRFVEALADTGMVEAAAQAVDMSVASAYRLRRAPGSEGFARAWEAALAHAADQLVDMAFRRVIEGIDVPVFDRDGCRIGARRHYSDRLMMFLLRAYHPERFRHAHRADRDPDEPLPAQMPLGRAFAALSPVPPPDPHLLLTPERLAALAEGARASAEVYDLYPELDRERYAARPVEADHPAAVARRRDRCGQPDLDDDDDEDL